MSEKAEKREAFDQVSGGRPVRHLWQRLTRLELRFFLLLFGVAGGLWLFLELGTLTTATELHPWDRRIILLMRAAGDPADPVGPVWFEEVVRDVTALGSTVLIILISASVIGFLLSHGRLRAALLLVVAVLGAYLLNLTLKAVYARPRPDIVPAVSVAYNASFPSGHAMLSAATYLTIGALFAEHHEKRRNRKYPLAAGAFVALLVGLSRIYLGVHWPSDVLAGWIAGVVWVLLIWSVAGATRCGVSVETGSGAVS